MSVDYIARGLARAQGGGTVTQVNSGSGLTGGPITGSGSLAVDFVVLAEWLQDQLNNFLQAGSGITITYDDTANTMTIASSGAFREFGTNLVSPILNDEVVLGYVALQSFTIAANFANWQVEVVANPVDTVVFSVRKNGVEFGTISIGSTGTVTFGTHTAQSIVAGDYISVVAPADVETDGPDLAFAITGRGVL